MKKAIHVISQVVAVLSFVFLLYGCMAPSVISQPPPPIEVSLPQLVIGRLIDKVFYRGDSPGYVGDSPGYVIADPNDPLQGTYSKTMKFTVNYGGENIIYELSKPKMVRNSESSPWHLAPDFEKEVRETLMSGYSN